MPSLTVESPKPRAAGATRAVARAAQTRRQTRSRATRQAARPVRVEAAPQTAAAVAPPSPAGGISSEGAQSGYQPVTSSVATLSSRPLIDVPQNVAVVTNQVIRDQQARTLDDALSNVSGVTQANTLGGTQDAVIRRGFGDNRDGSILRDGLRTALPHSFDYTSERVEVLKGPASALYGILDPGGMVNVVSKVPQFVQANRLEVLGTTLNGKSGGAARVDITGPIGDGSVAYRLIAEHSGEEYWRSFGNFNGDVIAPSFTWRGDTTTVTLGYEYSSYKVPFDRGTIFSTLTGRAVRVPRDERFDERYNTTRGETHVANAHITQQAGDHWKLNFDYSYSSNWYNDNQARVTAYNSTTGAATRRADATQDSRFDVHSGRVNATGNYSFLGTDHEFIVGSTYDYSSVLRTNLIRSATQTGRFNVYSPVYGYLPASTNVVATESDQQERISNSATYLQDSITIGRFILVGGVTFDTYTDKAGKGRPFNLNTDAEGSATVPRAGIVYKVTDAISLFATYSESFRPNSNIASYAGSLPPEKGSSAEGGIKVEIPGGITATLSYFDIDKKNVAYSTTGLVNGAVQTIVKTAGEVGSKGIEFDLAGKITNELSLIGSFGYTDAKVLYDPDSTLIGKQLTNVAKYTGSAFVTYDFGSFYGGDLRAGVGGRMQSKRAGDAQNTFYMPLYTVADAFVSWETVVDRYKTTLQLNVKNIFDTTYYTSSIGTNLGVEVGEPLRATLSARVEF